MKRKLLRAAVTFLFILLWSVPQTGCPGPSRTSAGKLRVTTTFLAMYVFTKNVAGDAADVRNLVPPNVGVHEYQFKPEDVKKIADSDVVVKNGLGTETWLEKLLENAGNSHLSVVDSSWGIKTIKRGGKTPDTHIWLDPIRAIRQVENIRDGLSRADPKNRATYSRNAARYIGRLRELDSEITGAVAAFRTRDFVAFHSAFVYFSDRYGLSQVATIEDFPGKEPNPKQLAELTRLVEEKKLKALFTEPQFSPRIVNSLAADLDVEVLVLDPIETGELEVDYWEKTMRRNLANLRRAMG